MLKTYLFRKLSAWLDRRGLSSIADVFDAQPATAGDVTAIHQMARRAIAAQKWGRAEALLQQGLALSPTDATLLCSLGATYRRQGKFEVSRDAYLQALALQPVYLEVYSNLGEWCLAQGQPVEALEWLEKALAINPQSYEARLNRTVALSESGQIDSALLALDQLVADEPERPEAYLNLGNVQLQLGKGKQAIKSYLKALELRPGYPEVSFNLASLVGSQEDLANAIYFLERRLQEYGESVQNLGMLASAYRAAGQIAKSETLCQRVLQRQPDNVLALLALANCNSASGNVPEAVRNLERVLEIDPEQKVVASNILFESTNLASISREELFARHTSMARVFEARKCPISDFSACSRDPNRKLRIGYVSGDFVRHPVGFLLRDILRNHDKDNFSIHCFSMAIRPQEVLPDLREAADSWEDVFLLSDEEVANLVVDAKIDILVDLAGHTALNRLCTFAMRPAPVQAEWIGYFHSTGMRCIDYFITDPHTSPVGGGQLYSETPVHLPHTRFCFSAPEHAPEVSLSPVCKTGQITFGSFNRLQKITDVVVEVWAAVLLRVPGSKLILKSAAFSDAVIMESMHRRFAKCGIEPDRLELRENSTHGQMLAQYGDIDIALDTFPFNGGMTTLEAAWMGVPVVTIAGNTVVSRQTVSVLANIGLADELAFPDVASYIEGAVRLAKDTDRLVALRACMRERMKNSPLCDAPRFTRDLEALYRRMWEAWCNDTKLQSDVS